MSYDLTDYVDVRERLRLFHAKYPDGSLQFEMTERATIAGKDLIIGRALAYRTPDDPRPGVGTAWEMVPGTTAYTRGSELQNLETSCWGRAIGSLGIGINAGIATAQEVAYAKARQVTTPAGDEDPGPTEPVWDDWTPPDPVDAARDRMGSYRTPSRVANPRGDDPATTKQLEALEKMVRKMGYEDLAGLLAAESSAMLGAPATIGALTKAHASVIFDAIKTYEGQR